MEMDKITLQCDVCGGSLTMQGGGQMAVCDYCGTRYALERLREKVQEIRGKVTVEGVVKTSSEDFEIRAGVLVKYHGTDTKIVIPKGVVKEIGAGCFQDCKYITSMALPDGLQKISNGAFSDCSSLEKINIPDSVSEIGSSAFSGCLSLETINIPDSVIKISDGAFLYCANLKNVIISDVTFKRLCPQIHKERLFRSDAPAHLTYSWSWNTFWNGQIYSFYRGGYIKSYLSFRDDYGYPDDEKLEDASLWFRKILTQRQSLIEDMLRPENWKLSGLCQHCGGRFKGVFTKTCEKCGKVKDY